MAEDTDSKGTTTDTDAPPPKPARKPRSTAAKASTSKAGTGKTEAKAAEAPKKSTRAKKSADSPAAKPAASKPAAKKRTAAKRPTGLAGEVASATKAVRNSKPAEAVKTTAKKATEQLPKSRSGVAAVVGAAAFGIAGALAATVGRDATKRAATAVKKRVQQRRDGDEADADAAPDKPES